MLPPFPLPKKRFQRGPTNQPRPAFPQSPGIILERKHQPICWPSPVCKGFIPAHCEIAIRQPRSLTSRDPPSPACCGPGPRPIRIRLRCAGENHPVPAEKRRDPLA
jgi:hypothetical protein